MAAILVRPEPVPAGIMLPGTEKLVGFDRWRAQRIVRSHKVEINDRMLELKRRHSPKIQFDLHASNTIVYGKHKYPTMYATVGDLRDTAKPLAWYNAQIHGYEEGASQGLFAFAEQYLQEFFSDFNFVMDFCSNPAGFERDMRGNGIDEDDNRGFPFDPNVPMTLQECIRLVGIIFGLDRRFVIATDMHETTWSDPKIFIQRGFEKTKDAVGVIPYSYIIELIRNQHPKVGRLMAAALEANGFPMASKDAILYGQENDGGVIYGSKIKTTMLAFLFRETDEHYAPTDHALLTEPYITNRMFNSAAGMNQRIDAQVCQIVASLTGLRGVKAPEHSSLLKPH